MPRLIFVLILFCSIAAAPTQAADEPASKGKTTSSLERSVEKAGTALARTANRAEKSVRKGAAATERGINTAGKKTGDWLNEKTK
jgi:hypothetical protein